MDCTNKYDCGSFMIYSVCNECNNMCNNGELMENVKKELEEYKYYDESYEFNKNILFLLNAMEDYELIKNCEVYKDKIIINTYNNAWLHLYNRRVNIMCVKIKTMVIYRDNTTIKINDDLFFNLDKLLFDFYECYYG